MHGIQLLENNKDVVRYAKKALAQSSGIMEFGVSRDYGSTKIISDLAIETNSIIKLIDPNDGTLQKATSSVNDAISFETICAKGEDVDQEKFEGVGLFHLDGFDIVVSHKHKQSTIDAYADAGIDLLKDGNVLAATSHYEITKKIISSNISKPSLVIFDDTWMQGGVWFGKGATAVPLLINSGFSLISKPSRSKFFMKQFKWGVALYRS